MSEALTLLKTVRANHMQATTVSKYFTLSTSTAAELCSRAVMILTDKIESAPQLATLGHHLKSDFGACEALEVLLACRLDPDQIVSLVGIPAFTARDVEIMIARHLARLLTSLLNGVKNATQPTA
jgi:hypothetical protein